MSPRLYTLLVQETRLQADANARRYFFGEDGRPRPVGSPVAQPDYADTCAALPARARPEFYRGRWPQTWCAQCKTTHAG